MRANELDDLREGRNCYLKLVEATYDGVLVTQFNPQEEEQIIILTNASLLKMLGYTSIDELIGKSMSIIAAPEYLHFIDEIREASLIESHRITLISKHYTRIECEFVSRECTFNSKPAIISVIKDITNKIKLAETESHLYSVISNTPIVLWQTDQLGNIILAEGKGLERIGLVSEQVIGRSVFELLKAFPEIIDAHERCLHGQTLTLSSNIENTYFDANLIPQYNPNGELIGMIGVTTDISELVEAEKEIRDSENKHRELVDKSLNIIFEASINPIEGSKNPYFTYLSPSTEHLLGYTPDEMMGKSILLFKRPQDIEETRKNVERLMRGESMLGYETNIIAKNGEIKTLFVNNVPKFLMDGRIVGFWGTAIDITDYLNAEKELQETKERLYRSQKLESLGRLTGGITHDLNNLLTIILNHSILLEHELPRSYSLDSIKIATTTASQLIRQLLLIIKGQKLNPKPVNLNNTINTLSPVLMRTSKNIRLELILDNNLKSVLADSSQMDQVIMNLIINGIEAMDRGGALTIKTINLPDSKEICLIISDSGTGMKPETRKRIFEPFFTTKKEGSGLGLATTHDIVKQTGGMIEVESTEGIGTTFVICLPMHN
ncbi:MAG: PAS domain S-box protein [Candidatus Kariarchaeaceae archaeon]|jgi:PAS domain S-box-containing protein